MLVLILSASLFAQLENTRWLSTINTDGPIKVIFDFKKDSAAVYRLDSSLIENMTFTHNDTSFTLHKVEGQSDCDNSTPGVYRFSIRMEGMAVKLISDDCNDRSAVLDGTQWTLWKEPVAVKVAGSMLIQYTGVYEFDAAHPITVTMENGTLYADGPNNGLPKSPLIPESDSRFFLRIAAVHWDFAKDANGKVVKLISHEQKDYELKKVK